MNLKNVFGTHAVFYYYGFEHLVINLYHYCKEGISNNELIYISMYPEQYEKLIKILDKNELDCRAIKFRKKICLFNEHEKDFDPGESRKRLNKEIQLSQKQGYKGIRWVSQAGYTVRQISERKFIREEMHCNQLINNTSSSLLCLYDYQKYNNDPKQELFRQSFKTHDYKLYKMELTESELISQD